MEEPSWVRPRKAIPKYLTSNMVNEMVI